MALRSGQSCNSLDRRLKWPISTIFLRTLSPYAYFGRNRLEERLPPNHRAGRLPINFSILITLFGRTGWGTAQGPAPSRQGIRARIELPRQAKKNWVAVQPQARALAKPTARLQSYADHRCSSQNEGGDVVSCASSFMTAVWAENVEYLPKTKVVRDWP